MKKLTKLFSLIMLLSLLCVSALFGACEVHRHSYQYSVTKEATCEFSGISYGYCECGKVDEKVIPALGHEYNANNECTRCGSKKTDTPAYTREGDKIYFGSYPQSKVEDSALTTVLNEKAGALPSSSNAQNWTDYGYYISGSVQSYMWYIDIEEGGNKYRGVYFTSYRPYYTDYSSSSDYTYQDDNGYALSTAYWFKYEPIKWRILKEENGTALLLCEMIIDAQEYYDNHSTRTINGKTIYPNNYAESNIRAWLNDNFYNVSFNEMQKQIIITTEVDNSVVSTGYDSNPYACENTYDKVFLLSAQEVMNADYGFISSTTREKKASAYAKSQGCYVYRSSGSSWNGNSHWWLRSPYYSNNINARLVDLSGDVGRNYNVSNTPFGVLPALQICLE